MKKVKKRIKHMLLALLLVSVVCTGQPFWAYAGGESEANPGSVQVEQAANAGDGLENEVLIPKEPSEKKGEEPQSSGKETERIESQEQEGDKKEGALTENLEESTKEKPTKEILSLQALEPEALDEVVKVPVTFRWHSKYLPYVEISGPDEETFHLEPIGGNGSKTQDISLKPGTYEYGAYTYNAETSAKADLLGSGTFQVTEGSGQNIYLAKVVVKVKKSAALDESYLGGGDVTAQLELGNENKVFLSEGKITSISNTETHTFVSAANQNGLTVTCDVLPNDKKLDASFDGMNKNAAKASSVAESTISATLKPCDKSIEFWVTKGQPFDLYVKGAAHYKEFKKYEPTNKTENENYDIYTYEAVRNGLIHYTAGGEGGGTLKQSGLLDTGQWQPSQKPIWTVDLKPLDNNHREDNGYYEANLYLNVDNKPLKLDVGGTFDLDTFRTWQAVNTQVGNYFIEPDFHFEVVGDKNVISLTEKGGPGRLQQIINGEEEGIAVIKITYDAMEYNKGLGFKNGKISITDPSDPEYYNAIAPENTGIVIVKVGGDDNSANIKMNIQETEYDTIYFTKSTVKPDGTVSQGTDHATYTFYPTADEDMTVRVHDPLHNTPWGKGWTTYNANKDGGYTIHLKEGRNIVEITAGDSREYQVINAKGLDIKIENRTSPGEVLKEGETVGISFAGLSQPVQKMAGIYNPGFPNECWVEYETDKGRILKSGGVQYDLTLYNTISFVLTEPGTLKLVDGQIHAAHLGSPLGAHKNIPLGGQYPNLNAVSGKNSPYFSSLPEIILEDIQSNSQREELVKLDYAQLTTSRLAIAGVNSEVLWYRAPNWTVINEFRNACKDYPNNTNQKIEWTPTMPEAFDGTLTAKYKQEGSGTWTPIPLEPSGKVSTLFSNLNGSISPVTYVEITATPKDLAKGYAQTYTLRLSGVGNADAYGKFPYITNVQVIPVTGKADMELIDGQLRAIDEQGEDLELGYGFLGTRNNYEVKVPYSVDQIKLKTTAMAEGGIETGITIDGTPIANGAESQVITLAEGENTITVTGTIANRTVNYTLHIIRAGAPKAVSFNLTEGAEITVYTASGKLITAYERGKYRLPVAKGYSYHYSKPGYLTVTETFEVKNDTVAIDLPELQEATQTFGDVSVRVMAQDRILRDKTTITFTADTLLDKKQDLQVQGYVSHNYGGYTALHALINAFDTGINKVPFSCYKGVLVPTVNINETGVKEGAGWVCEVNGKVCDPATTLVNKGDQIDFYYNNNYADMQHAWFKENILSITQGDSGEVTLLATPVQNDGKPGVGVAGAEIKANGIVVGTTDDSGKLTIPTEKISEPGQYTITAQKIADGKNILTYAYAILAVKKAETNQPTEEGKMTVRFRLIGDAKHSNGTNGHGKYVTWIATKKMTFNAKSVSVYDVFTQALDKAGLEYKGAENNYVRSITAPKAYGGYQLSEFTNGKNSGWMYTVNGIHPEYGLKDYYVTNGDSIVWHYVDDYIKETSFEGSIPEYPNRWLEAEDVDPPSDGSVIDMSKGNGGSMTEEKEKTSTTTVSAEAKVDANGKASATMDKKAISEAIKKVLEAAKSAEKANGEPVAKKVVLEARGKTDDIINSLAMTIPKESFMELYQQVDIISVKTDIGELRLDKASIKSMADGLDGDVIITIAKKDMGALTGSLVISDAPVKNRPAFEFTAKAGSKTITDFAGNLLFSLPYEKTGSEQEDALVMWESKADGSFVPLMSSRYTTGQMTMQSNHTGTFVIGYNEAKFTDTASHWAKSNITYLAAREIIKGKGANLFAPDSQITRAEFAQILANLSGADLSKYNASSFKDVADNAWYMAAVAWAAENGITGGTGNGNFTPNANITRQDMSVMIAKYVANINKETLAEKNKAVKFADNSQIAAYAKDSVAAMQKAGIINGEKNNLGSYNFNPNNNATRAEASTMIANYIKQ